MTDEDSNNFTSILNKKWKVFRVSPLFNFSQDKFKFYERLLNEATNSEKQTSSNIEYKSKFKFHKHLKLCDQAVEVLEVEIVEKNSKKGLFAYLAYFISLDKAKTEVETSVYLPFTLVAGNYSKIKAVHNCICKMFDCDIQSVSLSTFALNVFLVNLLGIDRDDVDLAKEEICIEYKVPGCNDNDKIKLLLELETVMIIFAAIMEDLRQKNPRVLEDQIIREFYNKVLNHIFNVFELNLHHAELCKINFSDAFFTSDGQIKVKTEAAALPTLKVLERFTPLDAFLPFTM